MDETRRDQCEHILSICREKCPGVEIPESMSDEMMRWIYEAGAALKKQGATFTELFDRVKANDFLSGRKKSFTARFGWLMRPDTVQAIMAGKYDDRLSEPVKEPKRKVNFSIAEYERMALEWRPVYREGETKP